MNLKIKGVDALEFSVKSMTVVENQIVNWGFKKQGEASQGEILQSLWSQGKIKIILSQSRSQNTETARFVEKHGDGISNILFLVDNAEKAFEEVTGRGARYKSNPKKEKAGKGEITTATISAMGDVGHTFISREGTEDFSPLFSVKAELADLQQVPSGLGLFAVDHMTCNLPAGELDKWAEFYEKIFGFKQTRFFDIHTGRTGLFSKVMENSEGTVKIPMNEPTNSKSQIQEYIDINNGPGVQHVAFLTGDIMQTLPTLRRSGQKFLEVPDSYYEAVPKRVKGIHENIEDLKKLCILADGENSGYLLQIFSQNVVGPFFYEVIQRCGNKGFGEGNFRALFEAMERDQEKRGVL